MNTNHTHQQSIDKPQPRQLSGIDRLLMGVDQVLQTLSGSVNAERESPAEQHLEAEMDEKQRSHIAGLMRVNHTGEVCAQALYQGQALTAKLPIVRQEMEQAAQEEIDHLAWCEDRLKELDSHTSYLNPIWYGTSFALGAAAGAIGDKWSLGFVAATEERVCDHLQAHLEELPTEDEKSRAVLEQMLRDERAHGEKAMDAGGVDIPKPIKDLMTLTSKLMTKTSYRA